MRYTRCWCHALRGCPRAVVVLVVVVLAAFLPLGGCGVPFPYSEYVVMDDGAALAVDVWLPRQRPGNGKVPTVMRLGRYWRDYDVPAPLGLIVGKFYRQVSWLNEAGYAVVMVDVRGTGASTDVSIAPWSPDEIGDFPALVDWVIGQAWSNGKVGAYGISYEGVTSDWMGAIGHPAVRAVLPLYSYDDVFLDVSHPGGLLNDRFVRDWAEIQTLMDRNDTSFLEIVTAADPTGLIAQLSLFAPIVGGVRPVNDDVDRLNEAITDHETNPHVYEAASAVSFRDDGFVGVRIDAVSPLLAAATDERRAAIRRVVGWQDAGVARGALSAFNTLEADYHVVVIAPHTHGATYRVDPYDFGTPARLDDEEMIREVWQAIPFFDAFLTAEGAPVRRCEVVYYTYGVGVWQSTEVWPPAGFERQRWYLSSEHRLRGTAPSGVDGTDTYTVDFEATTGKQNRWYAGLAGPPIRYTDRARQDERLIIYETPSFAADMELTGHPVLSLKVSSTHADGAFYAYLEDVTPAGEVIYLTEGQLRAIHRRVSEEAPPYALFGPYHTYRREDSEPLVPGEVAEIRFDLLPISTVIREGHRLRLALGGHDRDSFKRIPEEGKPTWTIHRNGVRASHVTVPMRRWVER